MDETLKRLNDGQREVFPYLARYSLGQSWSPPDPIDFKKVDECDIILLDGPAGTGKTYTINRLVEYVTEINPIIKFGMTAPTNKAVKVLKKTSECKVALKFGTIHHFLSLKEEMDEYTGKQRFVPDKYRADQPVPISLIQVLVLDETSQMNSEIMKWLEMWVQSGLKIIFMGDDKQIPPVGEVQSIPFLPAMQVKHKILKFTLNRIVRQAETNPIVAYGDVIRNHIKSRIIPFDLSGKDHGETGIELLKADLVLLKPILQKYFCTDEYKNNSDYMKVITWRNSTADFFNPIIRKLVFGDDVAAIAVGDKLVVDSSVFFFSDGSWKILFPTNEELEVLEVHTTDVTIKYRVVAMNGDWIVSTMTFKVYRTKVQVANEEMLAMIDIVHDSCREKYNNFLNGIKLGAQRTDNPLTRKMMWKQFYDIQKPFANVIYNYCITAHKSQGSTYEFTMVHEWDIDENRNLLERNRIRYVAASRARNKLFIVKQ